MPISPARRVAHEILVATETEGAWATDRLHGAAGRALSEVDRGLATELVLGVLRWRAQIDFVIGRAAHRRLESLGAGVRAALRLGVYQLRFLDRIPMSAAVHQSVELVKGGDPGAAGFVNAVLRRCSRAPIEALLAGVEDPLARWEIELSHPRWLLERWRRQFGLEETRRIAEYDNRPPAPAIRSAAGPAGGAELGAALEAQGLDPRPSALVRGGWRLPPGRTGRLARLAASGALPEFWQQDEGSQLIALLVQPDHEGWLLDACAAPGAKTSLLCALAPKAHMIALELHPHRARLLRRRLRSSGVAVVAADATQPLPVRQRFDRILADAPCTGTGTLARNPEIRWRLQPGDPARLQQLQIALVRRLAAALRPGGRLIFSVCSLEPEEGPEAVAAAMLGARELRLRPAGEVIESLLRQEMVTPAAAECVHGDFVRILPGAGADTDGFFAAIIERGPGGRGTTSY